MIVKGSRQLTKIFYKTYRTRYAQIYTESTFTLLNKMKRIKYEVAWIFLFFPGVIPPDTDLIFETEIVRLIDGPPPMNVFKMIDVDGDQYITVEEVITTYIL